MYTQSLFGKEDDTIISGVVYFWNSGSPALAAIIFIASIVVPVAKLGALALLAYTAQRGSRWRPRQRTVLYRMVEFVGRWSMLDIFVITLTVALVRFSSLAVVTAGPGALAFCAVVVLTMLASMQFDPRLIWDPPQVEKGSRWLPSLVWLVPLLAALIGLGLVAKSVLDQGPVVEVSFRSGDGLEAGKTKVKYKDVDIGIVRTIALKEDLSKVLVTIEMTKEARRFTAADTRFWVVRPRVGASGVSGLGTLLSGAYIGVDAGKGALGADKFTGLERAPPVTVDQKGSQFTLHADSLGSIDIGSPVFYRRIQVGQVIDFALEPKGTGVSMRVFVNAPYDQHVGKNTRWWHASGVDLRLDSSGFKLNTQSLAALLVGGIAFESLSGQKPDAVAPGGSEFLLADDQAGAMREPDGQPISSVFYFDQSLRGLSPGATVDFRGIVLGEVRSVGVEYDSKKKNF
eukprot:gene41885-51912_t